MDAAASGTRRFQDMSLRADALEAEAAQLAAKAAGLRGVADKVRFGNEGERAIGQRLDVLHGAGWHVLHDRRKSARSPANLDHVVVGPPGVVVIDAKNWSGGLLQIDARGMKLGSWRKDDALHAAKVDADLVRAMSGRVVPDVHCVGLLAFVQDVGLAAPVLHRDVVLAQQSQLLPWLAQLPRRLSNEQVDAIAARLEQDLIPRASSKAARSSRPAPAPAAWAPSHRTGLGGRLSRRNSSSGQRRGESSVRVW